MDTASKPDPRLRGRRALPAPPAALWTLAILFTSSAIWAILNA